MVNDLKISIKKEKLKSIIIFTVLVAFFATLFYFYWPFPIKEWKYKGTTFFFRDDLKKAAEVPTAPSCEALHDFFNSIYVTDVTVYYRNHTADLGYFGVEAFEIANKMSTYYLLNNRKNIEITGELWVTPDGDPFGSPVHPSIYLIGPTIATNNTIWLENFVLSISGRNLQELDRATIRALMCIMGVKI